MILSFELDKSSKLIFSFIFTLYIACLQSFTFFIIFYTFLIYIFNICIINSFKGISPYEAFFLIFYSFFRIFYVLKLIFPPLSPCFLLNPLFLFIFYTIDEFYFDKFGLFKLYFFCFIIFIIFYFWYFYLLVLYFFFPI